MVAGGRGWAESLGQRKSKYLGCVELLVFWLLLIAG